MFGVSHESASGRSWSGASQTRSSRWRFSCNQEVVSKCAVGCGPNLIRSARVRPAGCCRANQVRVFRLLDALGLSNLVRAAVFGRRTLTGRIRFGAFRRGELPHSEKPSWFAHPANQVQKMPFRSKLQVMLSWIVL